MAVEFLDLLSADHHAMDDEFYKRLGEHFTAAQIIELGFTCAGVMGVHRFIHTLDVYGDSTQPAPLGGTDGSTLRPLRLFLTDSYSHSMVPGGLLVTSSTTRLTSATSLVIRVEIRSSTS